MKKRNSILILFFISLYSQGQQKESEIKAETPLALNYTTEIIMPEDGILWGMTFLPDNSMLVTERSGKLFHYKDGKKIIIKGTPEVYARGQGGFLDVKSHPNYENNGWIYFSYASTEGEDEGGNTAIMRAKLSGDSLISKEVLYKAKPNSKKGEHFGSRFEFDNQGYLYFSIGERGNRDVNPQNITRDGGKIYRLHDDGRIPEDNPFVDSENAKQAIFSYGHRNPQGLAKNPETGDIWDHEHGPQGGDEINIIQKGKNYGWPIISYGINYDNSIFTDITHKEGMEQPLFYWVPSIAPCGMTFVTSEKYPDWKGNILVGALKFSYLERLVLDNYKVVKREKLFEKIGRVRNVVQAPDGYIYISVEGKGILKIIQK